MADEFMRLATYWRGLGTELFASCSDAYAASCVVLLAASLHKSGPELQGVVEEVRACYRKLRSLLADFLSTFVWNPAKLSISVRHQLFLHLTLRTHVLRGYASLLLQHAAVLQERQSRRALEAARETMVEVNRLLLGMTEDGTVSKPWDSTPSAGDTARHHLRRSGCYGSPREFLQALVQELDQSKLLDAWSFCFLQYNRCEDAARQAAMLLSSFGRIVSTLLARKDTGTSCARLLLSSPRLQYLTAVHLSRFLDLLDGGGLYGLPHNAPEAPLFDDAGELIRANRPGTVSARLVVCTLAAWCRILKDDDEAVGPTQFIQNGDSPQPTFGPEPQQRDVSQLGVCGGGGQGMPPLHLRATLKVCTRTASIAVDCLRAARAAAAGAAAPAAAARRASRPDPPRTSELDNKQLFMGAIASANACLNHLKSAPGGMWVLRPADAASYKLLWRLYVAAMETALDTAQSQPPLQHSKGRGRDVAVVAATDSLLGCDWWKTLLCEPPLILFWRRVQDAPGPHPSSPSLCTTAELSSALSMCSVSANALWQAGVVPLMERLIREKDAFPIIGGGVPWSSVLILEDSEEIKKLLSAAGQAFWGLATRPPPPSFEGVERLRELTAPLAWMMDVLPVGRFQKAVNHRAAMAEDGCPRAAGLRGAAESGASTVEGAVGDAAEMVAVAAYAAATDAGHGGGDDGDSGVGASSGDSDCESADSEEDVFGGLFEHCHCCGENSFLASLSEADCRLAWVYSLAAAQVVGSASRLFRRAAHVVCRIRSAGPHVSELEDAVALWPTWTSELLDWCQLLLTAYMASAACAAKAAAAALSSSDAPSSASPRRVLATACGRWRELLLDEVDLFGLLGACAGLLHGPKWLRVPPLPDRAEAVAAALRAPFLNTLRLALAAFPGELRRALTAPPRWIPLVDQQADAPLGFTALRGLLGPGAPYADAELLGQLAGLMRQWADPGVGGPDGGAGHPPSAAVVGVLRQFRAPAAVLAPLGRVPRP